MGLLFAEVQDHWVGVLVVLLPIIGGAVVWIAGQFWRWLDRRQLIRKEQRAEFKEDERTIVDHYKTLNERMDREKEELEAEIDTVRDNVIKLIRHVSYLEGVMTALKVEFKPFDMSTLTPATRNRLFDGDTQDDT